MAWNDGENGENFMTIIGFPQFANEPKDKNMAKEDNKNYRERYKRIGESEEFKKHYEDKSLGDTEDVVDNLSNAWHEGTEKPSIYKDKLTGHLLSTYALCIIWYDGWVEDLCRVTEDHKFVSVSSGETHDPEFFWYWAYTYDLIPKDLEL